MDEGQESLAECRETAREREMGVFITGFVLRLPVPPANTDEKEANMKAITLAKIPVGSFRVEAPVFKL